ncbi:DUF3329 domain-containing protein [Pseudaminobacter sp. 19-2017]|uniref:DUF3329 domain-containing protein n=1 Tax=Pseudaminobacter soli (ex Zhang et al. 2022) TaxID=2831468 RepID=A0A942I1P2_9HYPH|nr:DUF3329 domain-containing protein [Pseudaminobacter soli]MBS3647418.1 DUF3329 domain-containing protein [Pseudaminobacter soli]
MRDADHPFFRPLWRRVAIVVVCAAWSILEFWAGAQLWGMLAGGMAVYGVWTFLLNYKPPADPDRPSEKE